MLNPLKVFGVDIPRVAEIVEVDEFHDREDAKNGGDPDLGGHNKQ